MRTAQLAKRLTTGIPNDNAIVASFQPPLQDRPARHQGVGELDTIGAPLNVVNAVADALTRNGFATQTPKLLMLLTLGRVWECPQAGG